MSTAKSLLGTKEKPGTANNPEIIEWAKAIGGWIANFYTKDEIPWCGLFVAHCMTENGFDVPENPLSALAYANFGTELGEPSYGAVMVFGRKGGGHVGFYAGEDEDAYHILGGNQSDMVCYSRIAKDRLKAVRWPKGAPQELSGPFMTVFDGALSTNEQ
jgi:uncharacterized protein (TIGR02594 family)